ncbi:VG15 protein [Nonomuraea sediminis]|uniref:VG15 protein n=1 Tax=Nonomuraea sediminis TaxID=2835864 RepID=UPI001BDD359A|nr:hypothetical protein [Nonomuraea sediminis]
MALQQLVDDHYRAQQELAADVAERAQAMWSGLEASTVIGQWTELLDQVVRLLSIGQLTVARLTTPYLRQLAAEQGVPQPTAAVNPAALAGIASDGRALASLLMQPALQTAGWLARGADDESALQSGLASLTRIVDTQISDASRVADQVGITGSRTWVTYVRHVSLPACGRCIILAGRTYSWSTGFQRHERCDCTMVPQREGDESPASPRELFDSMTTEQQQRAFTEAGAEAIRLGADPGQIVNARRGMSTASGRLVTSEGTTRRGVAGRRMQSTSRRRTAIRPMPEQLLADAGGDREEAIRLLRQFGYLLDDPAQRSQTVPSRPIDERVRQEGEPGAEQETPSRPLEQLTHEQLQALSDESLAERFNQALEHGDEAEIERAAAEMARRDQAVEAPPVIEDVPAAVAGESWGAWDDLEISDEDRRVDELVAQGWEYIDAYAEVYQVDPEQLRREERRAALEADRRDGESLDQTVARLYRDWTYTQWLQAENATNGYMLNKAGQAAGIDPISLFSGPTSRATAYASEELRRWWNDHPRMTLVEFRAQVLGRDSDRRAARTTREIGGAGI